MIRVAGVDGGGTRTRCLVADERGNVLGQGEAGPANCATLTLPEAAAAVAAALAAACRAAGCRPEELRAVCAGLAGFYPPWHDAGLAESLARLLPDASPEGGSPPSRSRTASGIVAAGPPHQAADRVPVALSLFPDLVIAWAGGLALRPGVVLVGGTGSVAYGRNASGDTVRAGGWGYLAGDEGSAYWVGREALAVLARALDGRAEATLLAEFLPRRIAHGGESPEEWLRTLYRERWTPGQVAALAPIVSKAAEQGDTAAMGILSGAGEHLAALAVHVLSRLGLAEIEAAVVPVGGLLEAPGPVRETVATGLRQAVRGATLQPARLPPVAGAVLLALEHCGVEIVAETTERLAGH